MHPHAEILRKEIAGPNTIFASPLFSVPLTEKDLMKILQNCPEIPADALIVVNDADRSTPSAQIVKLLQKLGKFSKPVTFIIASGTHKPCSMEEAKILSAARLEDRIVIHNSTDETQLISIGKTKRGTDIKIHKLLRMAPFILAINGVEPHYFAGFTGGVKSLIPGCAGKTTTAQNHKWAMDPNSRVMRTTGNPIFEDLWEAGELIRPMNEVYAVQMVNHGNEILACDVGRIRPAFEKMKDLAKQVFGLTLTQKVKHIISFVEDPLDKTLYQAQKAMENAKHVLADGGTFVLIANCEKGVGTAAFFECMLQFGCVDNIIAGLAIDTYKFGDHKAFNWATLAKRVELLYIGSLNDQIVNQVFMRKVSFPELLDLAKKWHNRGDRILIDAAGGYTAFELK
jgi:nickel-dependent lactate racemase